MHMYLYFSVTYPTTDIFRDLPQDFILKYADLCDTLRGQGEMIQSYAMKILDVTIEQVGGTVTVTPAHTHLHTRAHPLTHTCTHVHTRSHTLAHLLIQPAQHLSHTPNTSLF